MSPKIEQEAFQPVVKDSLVEDKESVVSEELYSSEFSSEKSSSSQQDLKSIEKSEDIKTEGSQSNR
ncbi:MAG: hypothetical protein AAGA76_15135 [Pseudomonadota bacterium]